MHRLPIHASATALPNSPTKNKPRAASGTKGMPMMVIKSSANITGVRNIVNSAATTQRPDGVAEQEPDEHVQREEPEGQSPGPADARRDRERSAEQETVTRPRLQPFEA